MRRAESPAGGSILITSAPMSARRRAQRWPFKSVRSRTRRPASAPRPLICPAWRSSCRVPRFRGQRGGIGKRDLFYGPPVPKGGGWGEGRKRMKGGGNLVLNGKRERYLPKAVRSRECQRPPA